MNMLQEKGKAGGSGSTNGPRCCMVLLTISAD